jgi:flagellin
MSLSIKTNVSSIASQRHIRDNNKEINKTNQRLASGQRVVDGSDGGAELSISETVRGKVKSLQAARRNANDAVNMLRSMEGGLTEVSNLLIRMKELSLQASTATLGDEERAIIQTEIKTSLDEIDRIAQSAEYNEKKLLSGREETLDFQVGLNNDFGGKKSLNLADYNMNTDVLGVRDVNVTDIKSAQAALDPLTKAIDILSELRVDVGTFQEGLQHNSTMNEINEVNFSEARSRVIDADFADEVSHKTRKTIAANAGVSMLAQANTDPGKLVTLFDAGPANPMMQGPIRAVAPIRMF